MSDVPETIDQYIERISKEYNVIKFNPDPEIESVLQASQKERYGWDAQKCFQIAWDLKKYETYLGNIVAELNNRLDWFERNLNFLHGKYNNDFAGFHFQERCMKLDAENDKAIYLIRKMGETKAMKNIVSSQYYSMRDFIRILEAMGKVKNESQRS